MAILTLMRLYATLRGRKTDKMQRYRYKWILYQGEMISISTARLF
jgi:hypothetical protein